MKHETDLQDLMETLVSVTAIYTLQTNAAEDEEPLPEYAQQMLIEHGVTGAMYIVCIEAAKAFEEKYSGGNYQDGQYMECVDAFTNEILHRGHTSDKNSLNYMLSPELMPETIREAHDAGNALEFLKEVSEKGWYYNPETNFLHPFAPSI